MPKQQTFSANELNIRYVYELARLAADAYRIGKPVVAAAIMALLERKCHGGLIGI